MTDLVVPAGTTLQIDASFAVAPYYELFKMGANSAIRTSVDLTVRAGKAEFDSNCVIDARGTAGSAGMTGPNVAPGQNGQPGGNGGPGQRGSHVRIKAALAKVGGLMIITDGGAGGAGGAGGQGADSTSMNQGVPFGGSGGMGGPGGRAGQISLEWVRAAPGLPKAQGTPPAGHVYRSDGGPGGPGGPGGMGGQILWGGGYGPNGNSGLPGTSGASGTPAVTWYADPASMLWAQAQDIGPAPRSGHSIAYDGDRNRLVLFGGRDGSTIFGDTWEWDGRLWTQVGDTGPMGRTYHGSAFDPTSRRVLVFGGSRPDANAADGDLYFNDTWSWDGNGWIQVEDSGPSARRATGIAADPKRERVVLFSGGQVEQTRNVGADDTWEWDGSSWTQVADTGPEARLGGAMAYDVPTAGIVLFGGAAVDLLADTWAWDGQHWTQVADTGPRARMGHGMTSLSSGTILFSGLGKDADGVKQESDTWLWSQGAWRLIQDMGPSPRRDFGLATFGRGGDEVPTLFGGEGTGLYQDTWCFKERI